jgi:hypothetical protein
MLVIPALRKLRREECKFGVSLSYTARPVSKANKTPQN